MITIYEFYLMTRALPVLTYIPLYDCCTRLRTQVVTYNALGALHSMPAPVQVTVTVACKGNKVLKSCSFKDPPEEGQTVGNFFEERVLPLLMCDSIHFGTLIRTGVVLRGGQEEVEVDDRSYDAQMYVQLALAKPILYIVPAEDSIFSADTQKHVRRFDKLLVREPSVQLPV